MPPDLSLGRLQAILVAVRQLARQDGIARVGVLSRPVFRHVFPIEAVDPPLLARSVEVFDLPDQLIASLLHMSMPYQAAGVANDLRNDRLLLLLPRDVCADAEELPFVRACPRDTHVLVDPVHFAQAVDAAKLLPVSRAPFVERLPGVGVDARDVVRMPLVG